MVQAHPQCEGCAKAATFGLPTEGTNQDPAVRGGKVRRWCAGCAKAHAGAVDVTHRKRCEDCGLKPRSYGLPADGKYRWCGRCKMQHLGAVNLKSKRCEDCQVKQKPSFGLQSEGKRRWCFGCAKAHAGAEDLRHQCEACGLKVATLWWDAGLWMGLAPTYGADQFGARDR